MPHNVHCRLSRWDMTITVNGHVQSKAQSKFNCVLREMHMSVSEADSIFVEATICVDSVTGDVIEKFVFPPA